MSILTYQRLTARPPQFQLGNVTPADPSDAPGPDGERYPNNIDTFIPIPIPVAPVTEIGHYHVAQDYKLLFAVIIAIQTEIGQGAAGNAGTIAARLYGQGNIGSSIASVGYDRFQRGWVTVAQNQMQNPPLGQAFNLTSKTFTGVETGYGDGLPIIFARIGRIADGTAWKETEAFRLALIDNENRRTQNIFWLTGYDIDNNVIDFLDSTTVWVQFMAVNWKMP